MVPSTFSRVLISYMFITIVTLLTASSPEIHFAYPKFISRSDLLSHMLSDPYVHILYFCYDKYSIKVHQVRIILLEENNYYLILK